MSKKVIQEVRKFMEERGWFDADPADLAKSISIEAAELLEHFQWSNPSVREIQKDKESYSMIEKEIADVLIYSIHMSELLGLDIDKIIKSKLKIAGGKYSVDKIKGKPGSANYHKIKQEWRAKGGSGTQAHG